MMEIRERLDYILIKKFVTTGLRISEAEALSRRSARVDT